MNPFLILAFFFAALEALALWKNWFKVQAAAKAGAMMALFLWLLLSVGLEGARLWFGLAILLSLAGGVLLTISFDRLFFPGMTAFLCAHIAYIIGFNTPVPNLSMWGIGLGIVIGLGGLRVLQRIISSAEAKGKGGLQIPITLYSIAHSLMLLSAMLKQFDLTWGGWAALLVGAGASLVYTSDLILALNIFAAPVSLNKLAVPIPRWRIYHSGAYHLGQIALTAGVIAQYS